MNLAPYETVAGLRGRVIEFMPIHIEREKVVGGNVKNRLLRYPLQRKGAPCVDRLIIRHMICPYPLYRLLRGGCEANGFRDRQTISRVGCWGASCLCGASADKAHK